MNTAKEHRQSASDAILNTMILHTGPLHHLANSWMLVPRQMKVTQRLFQLFFSIVSSDAFHAIQQIETIDSMEFVQKSDV